MKIGYFGTPFYSVQLLEALFSEGHEILFVVTNMDKPIGRKKIITPPPVKEFALKHGIPVFQFPSIKEESAISSINSVLTDLNIVFAYGSIIPEKIFSHPICGTINLHTSLLPKYRGASPIESAILSGDKYTGVSIQYITEELDSGDIITQKQIEILENDNAETLLNKLTQGGTREILNLLKSYNGKKFPATPQDHLQSSHCRKILSQDRKLNFQTSATEVFNKIRAFYPYHTAYCNFRDKRLNILESRLITEANWGGISGETGEILLVDKKTLVAKCGDGGGVEILLLQPENKNQMTALEFINGYRIKEGERLT
ncbi:MAG: methionyl-tRNA formyltransferase [Leptospiraceae bacterium]|nr:methionyl-tRNA formyltransferase [Leptospiraceae bacterium]MCK6379817.1 methionyl-tRNA formyltransferase [Leptospiraceae bacterium]NUM41387.1 methionyl-tRNA formyltransferase [Leptospiraceae bacterium]